MEKIYFDDETFIWKTKLNLLHNKNEIIKQAKRVIKSHTDNVNDGFSYLKSLNGKIVDLAACGKQPLLDKIVEPGTEYCRELYIENNQYNRLNVEFWLNVVRAKNPIQPIYKNRDNGGDLEYHTHTHLAKVTRTFFPHYTFTYYIQMPDVMDDEDGVLYFKGKDDQTFWIRPEEDDFIIMPGDMPHAPNNAPNSTLDRIVMVGNVGFENVKNFKSII